MHTDISYFGIIACMFSFDIAPYSWYIEMYMGLFLLIPFLNILYDALETQKSKRILIATFLVLTMLPSVFNIYCIAGIHWWLKPSSQTNYFPLVPSWWQGVYPITYFYLGKYLKEFPLKLSALQKIFASLFIIIFSGIYNYYRSYGSIFLWGDWQDYGSFLVTLQAVLVFSLFANIDYSKVSAPFKHLFAIISNLSLGAYLISWIPDQIVYGYLNQIVPKMENRIYYFIPATFTVLISSLLLSAMINGLYPIICRVFSKIMPGSKTTHSS